MKGDNKKGIMKVIMRMIINGDHEGENEGDNIIQVMNMNER